MFEVGFTEILLILGLALLVLGPEKLPGLAEKVGRWTGRARSMARQLRTQLEHEVTMEELSRSRRATSTSLACTLQRREPGIMPTGRPRSGHDGFRVEPRSRRAPSSARRGPEQP